MGIAVGHGRGSLFSAFSISIAVVLLYASALGQAPRQPTAASPADDLAKYPGLLPEFAQLFQKIQNGIQPPPERTQSRLLPLLPSSTIFYAAVPNYGHSSQQALSIFHQELTNSPVLNQWWHSSEMAEAGPKLENAIEP